jgi:TonB family protein
MLWIALGTVLLSLAFLAARWMRGRSAAERCWLWCAVFAALLLLPGLIVLGPRLRVADSGSAAQRADDRNGMARSGMARMVIDVWANSRSALPAIPWLFLWQAGALVAAARFARAHTAARRLVTAAAPGQDATRVSADTSVPMVCGVLRPVIVLPENARAWSAAERAMVLAHERMHIARRDNFWQLLAQLACIVYWPQPLVWLAARAMRQDCERACDDGVLAGGVPASAYADLLIKVARALTQREPALAGGVAMTHTHELHERVAALLQPGARRAPAGGRFRLITSLGALALTLVLASFQPSLLAQSRFTGVVRDPSGANIPRARIDLRTPGSDDVREVIYSSEAGEFSLDGVPDGTYDMTVAAPGFALLTQTGLVFEKGKTAPIAVTLNIGKIRERVQVAAERTAPASPPTAAPTKIRVGGNIQSSKLITRVPPTYPITAKQDGVQGTVLLRAIIGGDGTVLSLTPLNKAVDQRLVDASLAAVKQWIYSPTLLNGLPVEVVTEVEINFTLAK